MKKIIFLVSAIVITISSAFAQDLQSSVAKLQSAEKAKDYIQLAGEFQQLANADTKNWLPHYYAAFCNAKVGWLYQDDGERIEPFANKAEQYIKTAASLLDTASQKKELSEVYCVISMLNRARVFVNPMTQGRKYGPVAFQYLQLAVKTNPDNPRAAYLSGWEKYYTPKMWGGDKKKAKELLEKTNAQLTAEQPANNYPHWGKKETEELLAKMK